MSTAAYLGGICSLLVVIGSAGLVALTLRRWLVPEWRGPFGTLAGFVLGTSYLLVLGEVLGTAGAFSRGPIVIACAVVGVAAAVTVRRRPHREAAEPQERHWGPTEIFALMAVVIVAAEAINSVRLTMQTGNTFIDSLEYHLTAAASFASSHHTGRIIDFSPGAAANFYPFNDELLHGMAMATFGRDTLSLLLALVDIGLVLLAAWCVGDVVGQGALAVCAVGPLLAVLGAYDASAMNDWFSIWPLLVMVAFVAREKRSLGHLSGGVLALVGLAAGLAIGAKLSLLVPAGLFALVCLAFAPRNRRVVGAAIVVGSAVVSGGYWFARDWIVVGSPVPSLHLPLFPRTAMSTVDKYGYSVAHYASNTSVIRHYFIPGLHFFFGPAWIPLLVVTVVAVVFASIRGGSIERTVAAIAVIAFVAYLVTPTGAFGPAGHPYLFGYNLRYLLPAVVLGLVLLSWLSLPKQWAQILAGALVVAAAFTADGQSAWANRSAKQVLLALIAAVILAAIILAVRLRRPATAVTAFVVVVLAVVLGYPFNQHYLHDRYRAVAASAPNQGLYASLQGQHHSRIGVVGLPGLYPFYGVTLSNSVSYIGQHLAHHAFEDYSSCPAFRQGVQDARLDFLVVELSKGSPPPPALSWTSSSSAATEVVRNSAGVVFVIDQGFGATAGCPG